MHDDALVKETAELFPFLERLTPFYLVGGTALAIQIGHRVSVDFDLFSEKELPKNLLQKVKRVFQNASVEVTLRTSEQINLLVNKVKTTFFYYPYPVVLPFVKYKKVSMVSITENAAMKAFSIGKRLSYKDYIDWYFLLKEGHVNLREVINVAGKKYQGDFNDRLFLEQLASFTDVRTDQIDFLRDEVDRGTVKQFLEDTVRNFEF